MNPIKKKSLHTKHTALAYAKHTRICQPYSKNKFHRNAKKKKHYAQKHTKFLTHTNTQKSSRDRYVSKQIKSHSNFIYTNRTQKEIPHLREKIIHIALAVKHHTHSNKNLLSQKKRTRHMCRSKNKKKTHVTHDICTQKNSRDTYVRKKLCIRQNRIQK